MRRLNWERARAVPAGLTSASGGGLPRWLRAALWVLLALLCLNGVFGHSFWGANDAREGAMIWDMVRHGSLVTPTLNGVPYLEKPPLLHWTGVAICRLAGRVNEGLVRLPAALYGFGTLVLLYLLVRGRREDGDAGAAGRELAAWAAVFMCSTAIEFHEYSRIVLTDMALTFMVTLSLYLFLRAYERGGWWRWAGYLGASAGAFYAKGLIGPAMVWLAVAGFLAWKRRVRLLLGLGLAFVPVMLAVVLPWVVALYRAGGESVVRFVFWDNQVGRFFSFADRSLPRDPFFIHKEPWSYYLRNLPVYLLPWTLLFVPALPAWWRKASRFRGDAAVLLRCAAVAILALLHLSAAKVAVYALPAYPFLFAMLGVWVADLAARAEWSRLERVFAPATAIVLAAVFLAVPCVFIAGLYLRPDLFRTGDTPHTMLQLALAAALVLLVVGLATAVRRLARSPLRARGLALAPAGVALALGMVTLLATPAMERQRSVKPFAALVAQEAGLGTEVALATGECRDIGAFVFYLDRRLPNLRGVGGVHQYMSQPGPRAVIVSRGDLAAVDAALTDTPHAAVGVSSPATSAGSFALVVNRAAADLDAANRARSRGGEYRLALAPVPLGETAGELATGVAPLGLSAASGLQ
ncbi:MAG TPA: phospholipid carrier-dependent glycosyltransferase [Thermoanaerobaculaceae bacterium]|nr:phospholipid carrier-dependent glycosyltransferase [Thermoanaerobaculaceae bacterium]